MDKSSQTLLFVAVRDINADEELNVNHDDASGATAPGGEWWFEEKKINPIVGRS